MSSYSEGRVFRSVDYENKGADDDQKDDEYKNPASSVGGPLFTAHRSGGASDLALLQPQLDEKVQRTARFFALTLNLP
jgi:hypothetical protein